MGLPCTLNSKKFLTHKATYVTKFEFFENPRPTPACPSFLSPPLNFFEVTTTIHDLQIIIGSASRGLSGSSPWSALYPRVVRLEDWGPRWPTEVVVVGPVLSLDTFSGL